ncbi:MAG: hypothetical protein K6G76_03360 [Lachnospiraceae bacterium]|nr:hypothetical protein [Lachnospiraceae bacterium]
MDGRFVARIIFLVIIFFGTIFVVNQLNNAGVDEVSAEMEQSAVPLVYVRYEDQFINTLHGYTGKVTTTNFRDTITPMDYGQTINLWATKGETENTGYEYELRSQYQGDLIENDVIGNSVCEDGYDKLSITFRTKLEELTEYVLVVKAMNGEEVAARYYTRVVVENDFHAASLLDFVYRFNNAIFDKGKAETIITKSIEPNEEGNNDYLSSVNIHSSFETITFADLEPTRITKPIADIKEIDDSYAIIQLKYLISATENRVQENYFITEDYRVRYVNKTTVYLLDYNRTQESIFTTDNVNITANYFKIGITDSHDFQYMATENQKKVAFVQARQLWYYDYNNNTISNVFGFCQSTNYTDQRAAYDANDIRIIRMEESGDVIFVVYGYMNSGVHEGRVGMSLCRYEVGKGKVDELIFVENDKPYNIIKEDMETLMYYNDNKEFFYFDNDCVIKVNTSDLTSEIFIEDVLNENVAVSQDNHLIAYPNSLLTENTTDVTILNLDNNETRTIVADGTDRLKAIGFVQGDLVLGRVKEEDIVVALDKTVICPIASIDLIDANNKVVKTYSDSGLFVMSARAENGVVYLERAKKLGGEFQEAAQDFITYKQDEDPGKISYNYKYTDNAYNQLYLSFPSGIYIAEKPKLVITKEAVSDKDTRVKISFDHINPKFYAFGQGHYMTDYLSLNAAVRTAYENAGVVTDADGIILWRKIAVKDYHTVADKIRLYHVEDIEETLPACIYMMGVYEEKNPEYAAMKEDISSGLPTEEVILKYVGRQGADITGCDFENGLYYLCKEAPVITRFGDGTYVLVTSYNGQKVRYINPLEEKDIVEDRKEFEEKIMKSGNVFISYVR